MKRGRYAEASDGVAGDAKAPTDDGRCHAFGCPLPGAISESLKGSDTWFCRFHFGAEGAKWNEITRSIRQKLSEGIPLDSQEPTQTVKEMRARVLPRRVEP